jgi:hypothetical protein
MHVRLSLFDYLCSFPLSFGYSSISQEKQQYTVLLILTDGEVADLEDTKRAIIAASSNPLSIIIIGIGCNEANFSSMVELDSDHELLTADGRRATRDIVQFVR